MRKSLIISLAIMALLYAFPIFAAETETEKPEVIFINAKTAIPFGGGTKVFTEKGAYDYSSGRELSRTFDYENASHAAFTSPYLFVVYKNTWTKYLDFYSKLVVHKSVYHFTIGPNLRPIEIYPNSPHPTNFTMIDFDSKKIIVKDNYAFVISELEINNETNCNYSRGIIAVFDISDPNIPTKKWGFGDSRRIYTDIDKKNDYIYFPYRVTPCPPKPFGGLAIFKQAANGELEEIHCDIQYFHEDYFSIAIHGDRAFLSGDGGVRVINIENPEDAYDEMTITITSGTPKSSLFSDGKLYVGDDQGTITIINFGDFTRTTLQADGPINEIKKYGDKIFVTHD